MSLFTVARVYDHDHGPGYRILIDRLWPRGVKKSTIDAWFKEVAPTKQLREWYDHDPDKWEEFTARYRAELAENEAVVLQLEDAIAEHPDPVLVYGSKSPLNQSQVLAEYLRERAGRR